MLGPPAASTGHYGRDATHNHGGLNVSLTLSHAVALVFEFDEFELDEALFELRRSGKRVHVRPKVLSLLMRLVRNRARVVTKAELFAWLWPDQVVGEACLTSAIRAARVALGDRGDCQHAVGTVRGFGYRFIRPTRVRTATLTSASDLAPTRARECA